MQYIYVLLIPIVRKDRIIDEVHSPMQVCNVRRVSVEGHIDCVNVSGLLHGWSADMPYQLYGSYYHGKRTFMFLQL